MFTDPETAKRKRVTRTADGKLTLLVNLGGPGMNDAFDRERFNDLNKHTTHDNAYPCQLTHFRATDLSFFH